MDVKRIEQRKNTHIAKLKAEHKQEFDEIKAFYEEITAYNMDQIKTLKAS